MSNYYNNSDDIQNQEKLDLSQKDPFSNSLFIPAVSDNQYSIEHNHESTNTSVKTQGTIPRPDILGSQIAEKYKNELVFNCEANCWMIYELNQCGIWSKVNDYSIEGLINKEIKSQKINGYGSSSYITNIINKIRIELMENTWQVTNSIKLLPFQNCVLEIATGKILNHSPEYRFTWCLPRDFDNSSNEFPLINQWLDEVTNNNESIKQILLCYLAAILKGRAELQHFLHLIGSGGTGKSTFTTLAENLIGFNNVCTTTLRDFCAGRFGAANAFKKRLVVFPDQDKYRGDLQKFKSLTGQDSICAEEKGKQGFQFKFDGMVIMASNYPVFDTRNSSWLRRRQILVPFTKTIDKTKRRDLEKEFQPELNALTQYLLNIPDETVTQVLRSATDNPELAQHTLEHQINSNAIAGWLDECVIRDANAKSSIGSNKEDTTTLFGNYTHWCRKSGNFTPSLRNFSFDLLDFCNSTMGWKDIEKLRTNRGYSIRGLRLCELGKDDELPSPLVSVE